MASLYRPRISTYLLSGKTRTPDGERVTKTTPGAVKADRGLSEVWYGKYTLPGGEVRRVKLCTDKTASKQILSKLVVEAKMAEFDLGGRFAEHARRLLGEHVEDYRRHLAAKENTAEYVAKMLFRLTAVLNGCRFVVLSDIQPSRVVEFLAELRKEVKGRAGYAGKSLKTLNDYLATVKGFTRWLWRDKRTPVDPLAGLSRLSRTETDLRHARRDFSADELGRLLDAARQSQVAFLGLSGVDRHFLYLAACSTGFRASELASMTPESFDLDSDPPTARVKAACTKNRKEAVQPIPADVAHLLRGFLTTKPAGEPVWPGNWVVRAAAMIRLDLEAARKAWLQTAQDARQRAEWEQSDFLAYRTAEGLVADFHALRHTYITLVGKAGVSPKEHQDLARHSTYALTARYTHSRLYDLAAAVHSLPIPTGAGHEPVTLAATGTDGPQKADLRPDRALTKTSGIGGNDRERAEIGDSAMSPTKDPGKQGFAAIFQGPNEGPQDVEKITPKGTRTPVCLSATPKDAETCDDSPPCPDRALTKTIPELAISDPLPETSADPDLARLLALWEQLPEGGRRLLRQTAEAITGGLPGTVRKGKCRRGERG